MRRVFQALRIAVNDEFGALDAFLQNLPLCLKAGGRVAILTFHSGEDRRVKKSFMAGERARRVLRRSRMKSCEPLQKNFAPIRAAAAPSCAGRDEAQTVRNIT